MGDRSYQVIIIIGDWSRPLFFGKPCHHKPSPSKQPSRFLQHLYQPPPVIHQVVFKKKRKNNPNQPIKQA
jgi:hypothetical protein